MAPSSHVSSFPINKTKVWTRPVRMTYLHVGVRGGEGAKVPVLQPGNTPGSRFLGAQHPDKSWWTCSPADCPTGQSSTLGDRE